MASEVVKIVRIDLLTESSKEEVLSGERVVEGGRFLTSRIVNEEVPPGCDPLGPFNKLIFAGGAFSGTTLTSTGRFSAGGKSPLTGGIKESNAGGTFADCLATLGLRALVLEGQPDDPDQLRIILVNSDGIAFLPAEEYRGVGINELFKVLRDRFGRDASIAAIGPGGERRLRAAGICCSEPEDMLGVRVAARGGLGAVMGSKGIKAVVVQGDSGHRRRPVRAEAFSAHLREFAELLRNAPSTGKSMPNYGTTPMVQFMNTMGGLPTNNFLAGRFEDAAGIGAERFTELLDKRGGAGRHGRRCMRICQVRCSNVFPGPDGEHVVSPLEYETLAMMGSNLGIGDLDTVARLNRICNDQGLDTIDVGVAIGVAMDCGVLPFGDEKAALGLMDEVIRGTPLGRVIGSGAAVTGAVLGAKRVPVVKNQAVSAYDPRVIKGTGVTYATSPQGGDHGAGLTVFMPIDHGKPEGQAEASRKQQITRAALDAVGICGFCGSALAGRYNLVTSLLEDYYDLELGEGYFDELGRRVIRMEKSFNTKAGFGPAHDRLPEFFASEGLAPTGQVFDVSDEDLDRTLEF
ncbi:MAG: aldehyde ferredoxin oxidoreductase [Firmicutes bacterium]|nr:aldehyde ferredoxin oxidoreductase [Bacillota bacterium]